MNVRPSDDRALDFSAYISFIGPTPRHMLFIHGRIPSLENCIFESVLTPSIFQVLVRACNGRAQGDT